MVLQSSGQITLKEIAAEFNSPAKLKSNYRRDFGVPSSGKITIQDFYGKSQLLTLTINENKKELNVESYLNSVYPNNSWYGKRIKINIGSGHYIYSDDTGKAAILVNSTVTANTKRFEIANRGFIFGKGGAGGKNANGKAGGAAIVTHTGANFYYTGSSAGTRYISILAGGGGGGAGEGWSGGGGGAGGGAGGAGKDSSGGGGGSTGNAGSDGGESVGNSGGHGGSAGGAGGTSWNIAKSTDPKAGGGGGGRRWQWQSTNQRWLSAGGVGKGANGGTSVINTPQVGNTMQVSSDTSNGSNGSGRASGGGGGWGKKGGNSANHNGGAAGRAIKYTNNGYLATVTKVGTAIIFGSY